MHLKLPNFIVVGFPKCGSTSLHYYLNSHPEVFMPKQKELHYFTNGILSSMQNGSGDKEVDKFNVKSFESYQGFFKGAERFKAVGDVSPSYINYPICINEIKERLGYNVKIIILVRDPIKRAFSNYLHLVRENREYLGFYEALKEESNRKEQGFSDFWYYTFNSMYYSKIKAYKEAFNDVMVLTTEEMKSNTREIIQSVYSFIGVNSNFMPENLNRRYNEGGVFKRNIITKFFFQQSKLRTIIKKSIPITPSMKHIKHKILSMYKQETPEIDPQAEDFLINLFKEDVHKLEKNFKVNTSNWNKKFYN